MRACVCGNPIGEPIDFKVTISPCRCEKPGPGKSIATREFWLDEDICTRTQYEERKRAGLPVMCEIEKSHAREVFK